MEPGSPNSGQPNSRLQNSGGPNSGHPELLSPELRAPSPPFAILARVSRRPSPEFRQRSRALEAAYLASDDPVEQSGFHGGRKRWIEERSPLVGGIQGDGDFLDVGCANGLLASDVVEWAGEKGCLIVPHGVDIGAGLVELARQRLPEHAANFVVADAWTWQPGRHWTYVYSLLDLSPLELRCDWIFRLFSLVAAGGTLIMGSYGSRSRRLAPEDPADAFEECGYRVAGTAVGGAVVTTRFAWVRRDDL